MKESNRVLTESVGEVWFRHPLTAEILESTLMPAEGRRLHLAFASELERHPLKPHALSDRALHVAAASDARLGFDLCREAAALERARGSQIEAANLHRRAVELWASIPEEQRPIGESLTGLYADLAEQLLSIGDFAGALEAVTEAYDLRDEGSDPVTAGRVITLWSQLRMYAGVENTRSPVLLAHAVQLASADTTSPAYAVALGEQAEAARIAGQREVAIQLADKAVVAAAESEYPRAHAWALMARLNVAPTSADRDMLDRLARASGMPDVVSLNCQVRAFPLCDQGDWSGCIDELRHGYEAMARAGALGPEQMLGSYLAMFQVALGHVAEGREVLRLVLASRPNGGYGVVAHAQSLVVALRAGNDTKAELHLRWLRQLVEAFEDMVGLWCPTVLAEYHLHRGRPRAALELLRDRVEAHSLAEPLYGDLMLMWCARAAADLSQQARDEREPAGVVVALEVLDEAVASRNSARVSAFDLPNNLVSIAARGTFDAERARCLDSEDAVQLWRHAADTAEAAGLQYDAVLAMLRESELLAGREGRRGGRPEAARRLQRAHIKATEIEAYGLRNRIKSTARAARISLVAPREESAPTSRPSEITARESEVLAHLAAGNTYAQIAEALFISQKTVSAHISNVLRKTGTRGRSDAVAWARRRGLVDD